MQLKTCSTSRRGNASLRKKRLIRLHSPQTLPCPASALKRIRSAASERAGSMSFTALGAAALQLVETAPWCDSVATCRFNSGLILQAEERATYRQIDTGLTSTSFPVLRMARCDNALDSHFPHGRISVLVTHRPYVRPILPLHLIRASRTGWGGRL